MVSHSPSYDESTTGKNKSRGLDSFLGWSACGAMNPGGNAEDGNECEAQPRDLQENLYNFYSWKSEGICMCSEREMNAPHSYHLLGGCWP